VFTPDSLQQSSMGNRERGRFVQAIACPEESGRRLVRMPLPMFMLLVGGVGLLSFGASVGASARPVPQPVLQVPSPIKAQSPMIVPLDVTLEDPGRPAAPTALAAPPPVVAAASTRAAELAAPPVAEGGITLAEAKLVLLTVPPGFSIAAPAATPAGESVSSGDSAALAAKPALKAGVGANGTAPRNWSRHPQRKYNVTETTVEFEIPVQINGDLVGKVPLRIGLGRDISVQVADLLSLMQGRIDPALYAALSSSYGVNRFVSFDQLRSSGIGVGYDAISDELRITSD
jgi:hypothetical protein